jgi:methionyl-tRNA formyltransferase
MRIVLFGQAAFGEAVFKRLQERGEELVAVYVPPVERGRRPDPLKVIAQEGNVVVFQPGRLKSRDAFEEYRTLEADLNVLAFVTQILPERILVHPKMGSIQYHPSLLPKHRGGTAMHWAIIKGDAKTGLTIFWPDKGIDTGPILLQKEVEIALDDTLGSLYFDKLFPLGIDAVMEAIDLIKEGKAPRIPQDESKATYEPLCDDSHARIDWSCPIQEVYNLIRGTNPRPGANTTFQGGPLKVLDSEMRRGVGAAVPGEVVEVSAAGLLVGAPGGAILVKRVQPEGGPRMEAVEFAKVNQMAAGHRLGS